jgi:hypothetical protein
MEPKLRWISIPLYYEGYAISFIFRLTSLEAMDVGKSPFTRDN